MNEPETLEIESAEEEQSLSTFARAEIDQQIATAKKYPRQLSKVKADMMSFATLDRETAESCFYTVPRGKKSIQGPSIRLAEIAATCFGNVLCGTRIIEEVTTGPNPHVKVQGVTHDIQNNVGWRIEKRRRIIGKKDWNSGGHKAIDEDDIQLAVNACSAIALREAILKVVPRALVSPVYDAAKRVAIGDAKTLATRRIEIIERLGKMGVTQERVLHRLEKRKVEDVDLNDLETLIGLGTAIRDGQTTIDNAFPDPELVEKAKDEEPAEKPRRGRPKKVKPDEDEIPMGDEKSPQQVLADIVIGAGFNMTQLAQWGEASGNIENPDSLNSFDDVPTDVCVRLIRAQAGLLAGLKAL